MNKKLLAILLALAAAGSLTFGLAACGDNGNNGDNTGSNTEQNGDSGEQSTPIVDSEGLEFSLSEDETCYAVTGIGICKDTKLYIPKTYNDKPVTSIGDRAFWECISLTSITIPDSVTSIGNSAFYNCSSLTSITIPDSVTSIGRGAFYGCSSLESITVEEGNTVYHSAGNCLIETESKTLIAGCKNSIIPTDGSVTSIGSYAFESCTSLTSVTIPNSVKSIEGGAFSDCSSLESITVEEGNTVYHSAGNCLIETESKTLIAGCKNSIIPTDGSVTSIGNSAFYECSSLTSITIPDSVTSIGSSVFAFCSSLESITFGENSQLTSIGIDAFYGCSSLTSITYNGTKEQWNKIKKGISWNYNTGNYVIHCTDGDIAKF